MVTLKDFMKCELCARYFKYITYIDVEDEIYKIVEISVYCKKCKPLIERRNQLQSELLEIDYDIFCNRQF